jgi:hypothetical protein
MYGISRRTARQSLAVLGLTAALVAGGSASIASADQQSSDVSGTVYEVNGPIVTLVTSDLSGRPQAILVDISWLREAQVVAGDPLQLTIQPRESDTYLARSLVQESPFVNREEFGVREEFTVLQDSIQARVGNVPEDDEALAKQHRDKNLRQKDDDDDRRAR